MNLKAGGIFLYYDIGEFKSLSSSEIIGIFDLDRTTVSKKTREYLSACEQGGQIENVSRDLPLSFILTKDKVYFSSLLPKTICYRASKSTQFEYFKPTKCVKNN